MAAISQRIKRMGECFGWQRGNYSHLHHTKFKRYYLLQSCNYQRSVQFCKQYNGYSYCFSCFSGRHCSRGFINNLFWQHHNNHCFIVYRFYTMAAISQWKHWMGQCQRWKRCYFSYLYNSSININYLL